MIVWQFQQQLLMEGLAQGLLGRKMWRPQLPGRRIFLRQAAPLLRQQ